MKAIYVREKNGLLSASVETVETPNIKDGEVLIKAEYSGLNYKDALGVTGRASIYKKMPIIAGIDVAGEVSASKDPRFQPGDPVVVTGCGLGETHDGGYAEFVVERADLVVKRPKPLSAREAMIYGTAGFTACLAVARMQQNGQTPEMGPIVVTGASGGVGQFAVQFFSQKKYQVWAVSGKPAMRERLLKLGAVKVLAPSDLEPATRPLEKVRFGGVVDNVGGKLLAGLIPQVELWGNVACIGLAEGAELHTTVMPLILRGVSLLGISSNNTTWPLRLKIWQSLAEEFKSSLDAFVSGEMALEELIPTAHQMLARETTGRYLLKL